MAVLDARHRLYGCMGLRFAIKDIREASFDEVGALNVHERLRAAQKSISIPGWEGRDEARRPFY